jgi:hypothetical protein
VRYLDADKLAAVDVQGFRSRRPYPWANPAGLLVEEGFRQLHRDLPELSLFDEVFGKRRKYGQRSHDRFTLDWSADLPVAASWREFVGEIQGPEYRRFLAALFGTGSFELRLHWHYTPSGCSVSPHCDAKRKLGSHIFYFQTAADWDPAWGGETLILDDGGRFSSDSAPRFEDFTAVAAPETMDNRSLLFARRGDSWHGVRELRCPPDRLRKVFIVTVEKPSLAGRLRAVARGAAA